ncbi:lipocalin-like domain-containing protein [Psychroserpens ponticola]|uniref:Lipocalin family protein n=1 Tax=Psychroserpens ponticola TaxID=2932268 RepID=A0ABY7S4U5_9FLAO|nr:lipocalin family protein [Psychroserpens ponticola]WCO02925.1 lipocalin family protein [Psychroserpens ponticola]
MKNFIRFYFLFSLIIVVFSCSDDNDSDNSPDPNNEYIEYLNTPNSEGQLLSEIYMDNDNATTYVYGKTDGDGAPLEIQSFAYNADNSNKVDYVILDDNQRVSLLYSETNGLKDDIIHKFIYPEDGLVNYVVYERDWITMSDAVINFTTVEYDGDSFTGYGLLRNASNVTGIEWNAVKGWLGVCVGVAGAAILVVTAPTVLAGVLAAVIFAGAASASEPPVEETNPDAPDTPDTTLDENQCEDSDLEVIIGVDPGNLLVAIVNGDTASYTFYWSTGDVDTGIITDSIVAPGDGNYYLMVIDDNGCIAFGSATIGSEPVDAQLLIATWYLVGETENGVNTFDVDDCNITVEFTENQLIATEFYGDACELSDEIPSNYEVNGNIITETADGDTSFITILELTPYKMVLQEVDGAFTYVETYTNIFGGWFFAENSNCVVSNGDTFMDNGSGELLTLNEDYTAILPDDSNGNYLTNSFTFENNILTINLSYQDFFSPACDGVNFQTATNSMTLTYDKVTNTFNGTSQSSRTDVIGSDCTRYGETCTGTVSLTR